MKLQPEYASISDVPKGFEKAFVEKDGKAIFQGGDYDFKTETEYEELHKAKKTAFDDFHEANNKLKALEGLDPKVYKSMVEEVEVLRAKVKDGGSDEETIKSIVDSRVARLTEDLTKRNSELESQVGELSNFKLQTEKQSILGKALKDSVSKDAIKDAEFIIGSVIERQADGTYMSNGAAGFEKGLSVEQVVAKALETRSHWKKQNTPGHGAGGAGGAGGLSKKQQFDELMAKQDKSPLSRSEANQLDTLAAEIKAEQGK
jgi:hypothetical protein